MILPGAEIQDRASKVRIVVADVDGVLTDGRVVFGNYGDELKFFDIHDGLGLVLLREAGIRTAMITARKSRINERRARELKMDLFQNVKDKDKVFEKLLKKFKWGASQACYIGDDLPDIPPMRRAGLAVAVSNAARQVLDAAHYVTEKSGGRGAVREVAEIVLKSQNLWTGTNR